MRGRKKAETDPVVMLAACLPASALVAAPTAAERPRIRAAETALNKAANLSSRKNSSKPPSRSGRSEADLRAGRIERAAAGNRSLRARLVRPSID